MSRWPIGWRPPSEYNSPQALALRRRDKGKPAARQGRKAYGLLVSLEEVAGLSNDGEAARSFALGRNGEGEEADVSQIPQQVTFTPG
jgi:hypothetical protein